MSPKPQRTSQQPTPVEALILRQERANIELKRPLTPAEIIRLCYPFTPKTNAILCDRCQQEGNDECPHHKKLIDA
jgi:hypothetical protein